MSVISTSPITRTQQAVRFSDGRHAVRCFGAHNPQYYVAPNGQLLDIDQANLLDTDSGKSEIGQILKREKNVVSVGMRKADSAFKYLGLRPDFDQANGNQQLEFSLDAIELDGVSQTIRLDKQIALDPVTMDRGSLIIQSTRQRTRQMIRATNTISDFRIAFELHLKGLEIQEIPELGEFWIFDKKGNFRFRIVKPRIIDPITLQPIRNEYGFPLDFVQHRLIQDAGKITYIKEPTKDFDPAQLPAEYFIDADTFYSTTADGNVARIDFTSWDSCRNGTAGTSVDTTSTSYSSFVYVSSNFPYFVYRSFLYFDTSGIGEVQSGSCKIFGYSNNQSAVSIQEGNQADTLATADFDAFTGSYWGYRTSWSTSAYNSFTLNSTGIAGVNTSGVTKICVRDYYYDYQNSNPGGVKYSGGYFSDYTGTSRDPYLELTTLAPPGVEVTVSLSGGGSLTLAKSKAGTTDIDLSGGGSVTGSAGKQVNRSAQIQGGGTLQTLCQKIAKGMLSISEGGQVTCAATTLRQISEILSGGGSIAEVLNTEHQTSALLSGGGDISMYAGRLGEKAVAISGGGDITMQGRKVCLAMATISESGNISIISETARNNVISVPGGGTITIQSHHQALRTLALSGGGNQLIAAFKETLAAIPPITAGADLVVAVTSSRSLATGITASGDLILTVHTSRFGSGTISGGGEIIIMILTGDMVRELIELTGIFNGVVDLEGNLTAVETLEGILEDIINFEATLKPIK